jgi:hypothetical protein
MTDSVVISLCGLLFVIFMAAAGALVWFVRLEGRVNTSIALQKQFHEWIEKEHTGLAARFDDGLRDVKTAIEKVFDRLDKKADK